MKVSLFSRYEHRDGLSILLKPGNMGLELIEFGILNLKDGEVFREETGKKEVVLVILSGKCKVTSPGKEWTSVGERKSVFEGKPYAVYIPSNSEYAVTGLGDVEIALCKAPADSRRRSRLITSKDIRVLSRGRENWYRDVYEIVRLREDAESLIVGETISGPGNWCSYPPHKHELEEMYFFKVDPAQGFGIQRIYTDDKNLNELYVIENNTFVAIPEGCHPLVAAPGYSIWFLYVLAAKGKQILKQYDDPSHIWLEGLKRA